MWKQSIQSGFTLLELLVTVAIIAILLTFSTVSFDDIGDRRSFNTMLGELTGLLSEIKNEARVQGTTGRLELLGAGSTKTINLYTAVIAGTTCNPANDWNLLKTITLELEEGFELTGSAISDICFYRDGTSSGGNYLLAQTDGGTDIGRGTVSVTLATSYVDVEVQ